VEAGETPRVVERCRESAMRWVLLGEGGLRRML
jgi:hypothetical protein